MAVSIPVNIKATQNDLPKVKQEITNLNREEAKAIRDQLSQLSLQRRIENEINREVKEQIAQRRRLVSLSNKLDRDLQRQSRGGLFGGLGGGVARGVLQAAGIGIGISETIQFAKESEELGRQLTGVQTRLRNTVGSTEEYNRVIALAREQTKGMTSEADLASGIFTFLNANLAENSEEAANLARAQGILVSTFENLGANEEKFIRLLASGNAALLDNFNLTLASVNARKAQIESTTNLSGEEARLAAIKELVIEKADQLEGSLTQAEISSRQFEAASADLTAVIGQSLTPAFIGAKSALADVFSGITDSIKGWQFATDTLNKFIATQRVLEENQRREAGLFGESETFLSRYVRSVDEGTGGLFSLIAATYNAITGNEEFAETYQDIDKALGQLAPIIPQTTGDIEDNTEALDKEAKRLEKLADTREKSLRSLLEIDRDFTENTNEVWTDWFDTQTENWQDYGDKRNEIIDKANKDAAKRETDFAKQMSRLDRDNQRDLKKITEDENKKIRDLEEQSRKERTQEEKKRKVDTLADERLFQFDLRQLAARGQANAIQEALERREIEKQIASEKASVEQQIEDEKLDDQKERIREEAAEKRAVEREDADLRKQDLLEDYEDEKAEREAALQEALQQEQENYIERSRELDQYRDDKLAQLEQDRIDSITEIGKGLTEIKSVTQAELEALVPVFDKLGKDAGEAYSKGLEQGLDVNRALASALGQPVGAPKTVHGAGPYQQQQYGPPVGSYQIGGIIPGPLGQPVLIEAHAGEEIRSLEQRQTNGGNGMTFAPTINVNGSADSNTIALMMAALQEYTDTVLAPALS